MAGKNGCVDQVRMPEWFNKAEKVIWEELTVNQELQTGTVPASGDMFGAPGEVWTITLTYF